jgi:Outer membrane protein beta-barrel domain
MKSSHRIGVAAATLMIASAQFLAPSIGGAAEPNTPGFYVGAMAGVTEFDDDGLFGGARYDDSDSGYAIFGGYKILKYLAVEVRLSDLGFDTTGVSGHVVGIIPFGKSGWEIFGQLGIGSVDIEDWDTKTVGSAGIGVRYYPTVHLGLSVQTDAYVFEEDDFGSSHDPSYGATQFGVHYLF